MQELLFRGLPSHAKKKKKNARWIQLEVNLIHVWFVSVVMADVPLVAFLTCLQPQLMATEQFNSKTQQAE